MNHVVYSHSEVKPKRPKPGVAAFYGSTRINVKVMAEMSPEASILAYYVTEDGEVVSDQIELPVEKCTKNKVNSNSPILGRY